MLNTGLRQVTSHTSIIELTIVVNNATLQTLSNRSREVLTKSLRCDKARATITKTERKNIIHGQTAEIEEVLPMAVIRNDKRLVLNKVWSILLHQTTLVKSLAHQINLQLLEIAYSTVNELSRTARSTLCEILTLEERNTVTA